MCDKNSCCQKPENLEGKPEACTAEQIRICHGDGSDHPCVGKDQKDE